MKITNQPNAVNINYRDILSIEKIRNQLAAILKKQYPGKNTDEIISKTIKGQSLELKEEEIVVNSLKNLAINLSNGGNFVVKIEQTAIQSKKVYLDLTNTIESNKHLKEYILKYEDLEILGSYKDQVNLLIHKGLIESIEQVYKEVVKIIGNGNVSIQDFENELNGNSKYREGDSEIQNAIIKYLDNNGYVMGPVCTFSEGTLMAGS